MAVALGSTAFAVLAQSSPACVRVTPVGISRCHYCQDGDVVAASPWTSIRFGECQACPFGLCAQPSIDQRNFAPVKVPSQAANGEYYCGLAHPSQWVTLRNASSSNRTYRQAASVNPYAAIALFSARAELSTPAEPNRFSLSAGSLVLERSFSRDDTIRGIEAQLAGRPLNDLGTSLPPNSYIVVTSESVAELDDPTTGEPLGFRITAYLENSDRNRTVLGKPAIVLVDPPRRLVTGTGESVEVYPVKEVVSAPAR